MSISDIYQKINIAETALKDAGTEQALSAVIDVLKEIAKMLEAQDESSDGGTSPKPSPLLTVPESRGRKFRDE
jgi:hypothetical protein